MVNDKHETELIEDLQEAENEADLSPQVMSLHSSIRRRQGKIGSPGMSARRLLGIWEVANLLGISPKTIYNRVGRKSKRPFPVKPKRVGRLVKFDRQDVDRYIASL